MPYGNYVYHLSTILSTLANPVACFVAYFKPIKNAKYIYLAVMIALVSNHAFS